MILNTAKPEINLLEMGLIELSCVFSHFSENTKTETQQT